jgi:tRNA nucleotidyltransferase (CCA-adding enzyme)
MPALESLVDEHLVAQHLQVRPPALKRSTLAELLAPFPLPALWALSALTPDPNLRERLLDYLTRARQERPILTGDELLELGLLEGRDVGEFLRYLRNARLDGEMRTREDEMEAVRELMRLRRDVILRELVRRRRLREEGGN